MEEFSGDGGLTPMTDYSNGPVHGATSTSLPLTVSGSFKEGKSSSRRRGFRKTSMDGDELINLLHGSDLIKVELNRLKNEVRDKNRELGEAHAQIKALKLFDRASEKACEELTDELLKVEEKLKLTESLLESKNLENQAFMAAQFAAEATLRSVHPAQKDDDMPPIEAILAPLEAELKLAQ
ncbi:hypothetical protein ACFX2A_000413 [Malus domestica]